jgi:hypothetical protein
LEINNWTQTTNMGVQNAASEWAAKQLAASRGLGQSSEAGPSRITPFAVPAETPLLKKPGVPEHFPETVIAEERKKWEDFERRHFVGMIYGTRLFLSEPNLTYDMSC